MGGGKLYTCLFAAGLEERQASSKQARRIFFMEQFFGGKEGQKCHLSHSECFWYVHANFTKLFVWKETTSK